MANETAIEWRDATYQPWRALDVANTYGVRVDRISEVFRIEHGRPVERIWRVEFNSCQMTDFRESWYGPKGEEQREPVLRVACNVRPDWLGEHRCCGEDVPCECQDPLCRMQRGDVTLTEQEAEDGACKGGAMSTAEMLAEFHAAAGDERGCGGAKLRLALHCEEHEELLDELSDKRLGIDVRELKADEDVDRAKLARELADVVYVSYGTAYVFGIELEAALAEIHRAAMSKLDPPCENCNGTGNYEGGLPREEQVGADDPCEACDGTGKGERVVREDGKVMKPPGFVPPDMSVAVGEERADG